MIDWEKKAIEELKGYILFLQGQICSTLDKKEIEIIEKELKSQKSLLNLIEKQEKVIDYMVDRIEWLLKSNGMILDFEHKDNFTKEDIKEYFYKKV